MRTPTPTILTAALIWLLLIIPLTGCENVISPLSDESENILAVHGVLDMAADTQFVRISGLRQSVLADDVYPDDLTVQLRDSESGQTFTMTDSTVVLEDGTNGLLYYSLFTPLGARTYVLQIFRSGEMLAQASTRLPDMPVYFVSAPMGDSVRLSQAIVLLGISGRPYTVAVAYEVSRPTDELPETVLVEYPQDGTVLDNGWQFEVFLAADQYTVISQIQWFDDDVPLQLRKISASIGVLSEEWDNAESPRNMENAHGFFGSIGRFDLAWTLAPEAVETIGYEDKQGS